MDSVDVVIIGLCGQKNSGKTTVCNYIAATEQKNEHVHRVYKYAFAKPLKEIAKIFGFNDKQLNGSQDDKNAKHEIWNISSREFMQKFGTEIIQHTLPQAIPDMNLGPSKNLWVCLFEQYCRNICNTNINCHFDAVLAEKKKIIIIVEDIRFMTEANAIRELNGVIIKIQRTTSHELQRSVRQNTIPTSKNELSDLHQSETELLQIPYDYIVYNIDDNLPTTTHQVDQILNVILQ